MKNTSRKNKAGLMISRRCHRMNNRHPTLYMEWSINEHGECQTEVNVKGYFGPINGTMDISVICTDPLSHRKATENAVDAVFFKLICMGFLISKAELALFALVAERNEIMEKFGDITNITDDAFPWEHNGFLGKRQ